MLYHLLSTFPTVLPGMSEKSTGGIVSEWNTWALCL